MCRSVAVASILVNRDMSRNLGAQEAAFGPMTV